LILLKTICVDEKTSKNQRVQTWASRIAVYLFWYAFVDQACGANSLIQYGQTVKSRDNTETSLRSADVHGDRDQRIATGLVKC
jgi:hypothetical protein